MSACWCGRCSGCVAARDAGDQYDEADRAEALGLVERLRNGGQPDLADMAQELIEALRWMLDAFHEDPMGADTSGAVDAAYDAIAKARQE
jgi:hypothetical protein